MTILRLLFNTEVINVISLALHTTEAIPDTKLTALNELIVTHQTLEQITNWVFGQSPPIALLDMISQDEFTIDVVIRYTSDLYLVYGVT